MVVIFPIMTFTNLEEYVYSKKCLKQRRQPPLPLPLAKSKVRSLRRYFRDKKSPGHGGFKRFEWVIFSQPRGDRVATIEEGEVQIFFLISFLSRNSSAR